MFSGFQYSTIDDKGRIKFPMRLFKQVQDLNCEEKFMLTLHPSDTCLVLYPLENWHDVALKINKLPVLSSHAKLIKRRVVGYATACELDSNSRILVPSSLREIIEMSKKVCISGQGSGFEIWSEQAWQDSEAKLALLTQTEAMPQAVIDLSL